MTHYAEAVNALYDVLGTWEKVAVACGFDSKRRNYVRKIASGEIKKPRAEARRGIAAATEAHVTGLLLPRGRARRGGIAIQHPLWLELQEMRKRREQTWDELLSDALILLRRDAWPTVPEEDAIRPGNRPFVLGTQARKP
jgi:hypothetical protein